VEAAEQISTLERQIAVAGGQFRGILHIAGRDPAIVGLFESMSLSR
jgi:hypothetical protein